MHVSVCKMATMKALVLACSVLAGVVTADQLFPPGFSFGAASSSYQIEGAWNASDKGLSIWDTFTHKQGTIKNGDGGDTACNSYYLYKRDIEMAEELGLQFYRFSISWPRLLPTGFPNRVSEAGSSYYNALIDELVSHGIEPLVTIYHWELPQTIQDLGGWTNPLIVNWFSDYVRVVYTLFGDRVKTWITINEPVIMCDLSYKFAVTAPGVLSSDIGSFLCSKHVLLAHAAAYRLYDEEFRAKYHGKVSLTNQALWLQGVTEDDEDDAEILRQYHIGIYSHPIYSKEGGWPPVIEKILAEKSKREGYPHSRLPAFSQEEIEFVRGTFDYYGLNYYSSRVVRRVREGEAVGEYPLWGVPDLDMTLEQDPRWAESGAAIFRIYPEGLRKLLSWLKTAYGDLEIMILENGYAGGPDRDLVDHRRMNFLHDHLEQILLSIKEDNVNVTKYTFWTLMDNFEWNEGYSVKFGLYEVDFQHPLRTRTPRSSAKYYKKIIKTHSLVPSVGIKSEL